MVLDIILVAVLIVWAVFGYRKGFIKQIFVLAGIVAVVFLAPPLSEIAQKVLQNEFGIVVAGRFLHGLLFAACSSLIYIVSYTIGYFLHDTLVKGIPVAERTNHVLGGTLGVLEAMTASYLILGVFAVGSAKIEEYAPAVYEGISESAAYRAVAGNNIFEHFDYFQPVLSGKKAAQDVSPPAGVSGGKSSPEAGGDASGNVPVGTENRAFPDESAAVNVPDKPADTAVKGETAGQDSGGGTAGRGTVHRKVVKD
ncbi:MAG: CvpA family protein [Proteobacteria bacterium]|nr:CvpA family protein [Pseudomonadota bacterium]